MFITRRRMLALAGSSLLCGVEGRAAFDVDRLLDGDSRTDCQPQFRKYTASATVMLFSIPLVSKSGVGSGYAVIEEADAAAGRTISIQFGAGSYPGSARGLNRLGFIQEAIVEDGAGHPTECAWLAFMTTSKESSLDQAKRALETSGAMVPYSASQGCGRKGRFTSRVERLEFPSKYTWRDITQLVDKARGAMTAGVAGQESGSSERSATFLYLVRRAMIEGSSRTSSSLVFNGKEFQLDAQKEKDVTATLHFIEKKLVPPSGFAMRLDATLTEKRTGVRTPFRLWYEAGAEQAAPLRFEYQAKSFLRLTFEAAAGADTPPIKFAFKTTKEHA